MLKLILWGIVAVIAWYVLAPLFTPRPLRGPRRRRRGVRRNAQDKVIDAKGKVIK